MTSWIRNLSIADHIRIGNLFKDIRQSSSELSAMLPPKSSRLGQYFRPNEKAIIRIIGELDSQLSFQLPRGDDPRGLFNHVYYAEGRLVRSLSDEVEDKHDAFAGWALIKKEGKSMTSESQFRQISKRDLLRLCRGIVGAFKTGKTFRMRLVTTGSSEETCIVVTSGTAREIILSFLRSEIDEASPCAPKGDRPRDSS